MILPLELKSVVPFFFVYVTFSSLNTLIMASQEERGLCFVHDNGWDCCWLEDFDIVNSTVVVITFYRELSKIENEIINMMVKWHHEPLFIDTDMAIHTNGDLKRRRKITTFAEVNVLIECQIVRRNRCVYMTFFCYKIKIGDVLFYWNIYFFFRTFITMKRSYRLFASRISKNRLWSYNEYTVSCMEQAELFLATYRHTRFMQLLKNWRQQSAL